MLHFERRPLKDHWKTENWQGLSAVSKISEICCLCGMAPKTPERPLKDQKQLFQQDPRGPWRQLKVYWETNQTIERSLKDHLAYCQRSVKDQSRSLKDWPRPLKELWKTDQDPRENSERLTETAARILKERDNRDCRKIMERLIRPLKVHWEIAERLLKDHFPERPLKDCFEPFQKVLETTETTKTTERSARNRERPRRSLKVHWKTIERSSKFQGLSAVLLSVEWGFNS